jgi:hypothetical protein
LLKTFALIGLGAAVVVTPLAVLAQTNPSPAVGAAATSPSHATAHRPTGSYRSEMRRRHQSSKDRARAGAEHVRMMRSQ